MDFYYPNLKDAKSSKVIGINASYPNQLDKETLEKTIASLERKRADRKAALKALKGEMDGSSYATLKTRFDSEYYTPISQLIAKGCQALQKGAHK